MERETTTKYPTGNGFESCGRIFAIIVLLQLILIFTQEHYIDAVKRTISFVGLVFSGSIAYLGARINDVGYRVDHDGEFSREDLVLVVIIVGTYVASFVSYMLNNVFVIRNYNTYYIMTMAIIFEVISSILLVVANILLAAFSLKHTR